MNGEALTSLDGAPVVVISSHLSYSDANVIEVLLQRAGGLRAARVTVRSR